MGLWNHLIQNRHQIFAHDGSWNYLIRNSEPNLCPQHIGPGITPSENLYKIFAHDGALKLRDT